MSLAVGISGSVFALALCAALLLRVFMEMRRPSPAEAFPGSPSRAVWRREMLIVVLGFIVSRAAIYLYAWRLSGGNVEAFRTSLMSGDSEHYMYLAENGYTSVGEKANLIVFYPLFPMVMRCVMLFVRDPFLSGVIVSNVCTLGACLVLYRWVREETDAERAFTAVGLLLLYPFAIFTVSCFTEGLFIFLSLLCAYSARRGKFVRCGIFGFLAALTRTQGVILFGLAAYEWWIQLRDRTDEPGFFKPFSTMKAADVKQGLALLLIPAGYGIYLRLNAYYFHDPFAFVAFEAAPPWYQGTAFFGKNLIQHMNMAKDYPGLANIIYLPQAALFFAVCIVVLIGLIAKSRTSLLLYSMAYLLVSYTASWLISGGRYLFSDFPIYIILATGLKKRWLRIAVLLTAVPGALFYLVRYLQNYAIM